MKLIEFSYKNILSYGNLLQTFKFGDTPQLIQIEGENGAGKSTIKEALTVSIYGKSAIRKMKDIPNWINRNAFTNIKFITNSGEAVEINRGIDPNFSDITINGSPFNLPDKRKVDEFIEDELARIPFTVFCNTVSLSFDDFKSFINLSQADKRKIVDKIFGLDILSDMRTLVKEDLKLNKKDLEIINSQILKNTVTLETSVTQLAQLKEKLLKKKESKTDDLSSKIELKKSELATIKEKYSAFSQSIKEIQSEINTIRDENSKVKASISDFSEKLEIYKKNRCPHCLNDLTSESSVKTKEAIENRKALLEAKLPGIKELFTKATADLEKITNDQNLAKSDYYSLNAEIQLLESELAKTVSVIESDETESIQTIINSIKSELLQDESKSQIKSEEVELFNILDNLLSDSGIKKTLLDKIIPTLNSRIFDISEKLEFKFQFEFDSNFDPHISYLGMEVSPESLSSGQRKKMNLIVLLAFIELIKMKHSSMNVMFLDEIFSSLDKNNVYRAIEILREYSNKYNLTIFVVSHESLPEEFFDSKILVKTRDHFSEMSITKIGN